MRTTCNNPKCGNQRYGNNLLCKKHARAAGAVRPRRPVSEALARVDELKAAGMTDHMIVEAAGLGETCISQLRSGKIKKCQASTLDALNAVVPPQVGAFPVEAWPARRRVHALRAIGITAPTIAKDLGVSNQAIYRLSYEATVSAKLDAAVRDYYAKREATPMGTPTVHDARRRWKKPFSWDDIDDPEEAETGNLYRPQWMTVTEAVRGWCRDLVEEHGTIHTASKEAGVHKSFIGPIIDGSKKTINSRAYHRLRLAHDRITKPQENAA